MIDAQIHNSKTDKQTGYLSRGIIYLVIVLLGVSGCSLKRYATNVVADTMAQSGSIYASDDDIELVGMASPFGLKTIESVLERAPQHRGLLLAATRGFTQYAYVYVDLPAARLEERNVNASYDQRARARRLYLRARDYGLRGLQVAHPQLLTDLHLVSRSKVQEMALTDVPLLYWTGLSWAAAISLGKDEPELVADLPVVEAFIDRALELDETFDHGALHVFLISYEMNRQGLPGDPAIQARRHFDRAVKLSGGLQAAPYVALAEAVSVPKQNRREYESLLQQALEIDISTRPEWTLANLVMQRRARWLLSRVDEFFSN